MPFTLMLLCLIKYTFCSAVLGGIIFLEYNSGLWTIGHRHIWGSVTVAGLFQNYKNRSDSLPGAFMVKLLICYHVGFSWEFGS